MKMLFNPKINEPLVRAVMERISDNLDHWDQETYADPTAKCGTTACFAGNALIIQGYTVDGKGDFYTPAPYNTRVLDCAREAQAELGFTDNQAGAVFFWRPNTHMPDTTQEERYKAFAARVEEYTGIAVAV